MTQRTDIVHARRPKNALATRQRLTTEQLGFPIRILAHSQAPIVPQRVGNWWMEPLQPDTPLPGRARARLRALLDAGVTPKAIVVFHEIPPTTTPPSRTSRVTARLHRFAEQEVPVLVGRATTTAKRHGPTVGRFALRAGALALTGAALVGTTALFLAGSVLAAVVADPCLVVVTDDGDWIEVDRWYD